MSNDPTRASLLVRLRDPRDADAWARFVRIYSPLVFHFARRSGLQDADAADVTQDVLQSVHRRIEQFEYDPQKGAFRGWLRTVARARVADWIGLRRRQPVGAGGTEMAIALSEHAGPEEEAAWERDYRKAIFDAAIEKVRPEFQPATFSAFWETAVEGRPVAETADRLGLSSGAIYIARSRITARLRDVIAAWEREESDA
ncbi:MAG: sigma-70 family RNA polymerase sigma factor [Planctomyces sp.]|nr:sigma-70 family RNA polymerase sigma factor [Planctomyces sp.]